MTTASGLLLIKWADTLDKRLVADILGPSEYHGTREVVEESVALIEQEVEARYRDRVSVLRDLLKEAVEAYHVTDTIRNHVDPTDKTGWNVKGIETCADPLCVDALKALRD